jgi:hypothetical protein
MIAETIPLEDVRRSTCVVAWLIEVRSRGAKDRQVPSAYSKIPTFPACEQVAPTIG